MLTCPFVFILPQKPVLSGDLSVPGNVSLVSVVPSQSAVSPAASSRFLPPGPGRELLSDFQNNKVVLVLLGLNHTSYLFMLKPWKFPLTFCARKRLVWGTGCGITFDVTFLHVTCCSCARKCRERAVEGFLLLDSDSFKENLVIKSVS